MSAVNSGPPLRILSVADTPPDPHAGASGTDLQTVMALRNLGHHVVAVWHDALPHRIRHGNLHYAFELPRAYRNTVRSCLERATFDVVLVSQPHGYLAARWIRDHVPDTVFVSRSHGWEAHVDDALLPFRRRWGVPRWRFPRGLVGWPIHRLLRSHCTRVARASHGILTSATACRDYILNAYQLDPSRVALIPQAPPDDYRGIALPPRDRRVKGSVLLVGGPDFFKGVDVAEGVIRACARERLPWHFTWIAPEARQAELRARLAGITPEVVTLRPNVAQQDLRATYDGHEILLFPSLVEGFGKAFLEAMSRGLCVIASDVGGMHDVIRSGVDGILCPAGDVQAFVAALRSLAASKRDVARLGDSARTTALAYSWQRVAEETAAFFHALLVTRRSRSSHP